MKKVIFIILFPIIFSIMYGQRNVTTFLDIPVYGTEKEVISKLINKRFVHNEEDNTFHGKINKVASEVYIFANQDSVYRILALQKIGTDQKKAIEYYNNMCEYFETCGHYIPENFYGKYTIPPDAHISQLGKQYKAVYYQFNQEVDEDTNGLRKWLRTLKIVSDDEIDSLNELDLKSYALDYTFDKISFKKVWFTLKRIDDEYYLYIFFDNVYKYPQKNKIQTLK